jgi:hypothetical protein
MIERKRGNFVLNKAAFTGLPGRAERGRGEPAATTKKANEVQHEICSL